MDERLHRIRNAYDLTVEQYDCNSGAPENKEFLEPEAGMCFLDVGSGASLANYRLDLWPSKYFGIDISRALIQAMHKFSIDHWWFACCRTRVLAFCRRRLRHRCHNRRSGILHNGIRQTGALRAAACLEATCQDGARYSQPRPSACGHHVSTGGSPQPAPGSSLTFGIRKRIALSLLDRPS